MIIEIIVCLVIGYIFGCLQTGYFYGRLHGIDIRNYGSGNVGTTNTLRTLGKKAGYITYLGDVSKGDIRHFTCAVRNLPECTGYAASDHVYGLWGCTWT